MIEPPWIGRKIGVEHRQAVPIQERFDGGKVVVEQMLVIDLVEGAVLDDLLHVEELDDEHAVVAQRSRMPSRDGMQFFQVEEDAGRVDGMELAVQVAGDFVIEELR